jgi:hypothetical protein
MVFLLLASQLGVGRGSGDTLQNYRDSTDVLEILANSSPIGEGAVFQFGMAQTASIDATVYAQGSMVVSSQSPIVFQLRLETDDNAGIYCPVATDNPTAQCLFTIIEIRQ